MSSFSTPRLKKAIKVALDMGLPVAGYEVLADGGIRVLTVQEKQDQADAALDAWARSQRG
ncbi:hypothetical protein [Paracoccus spongiarum]|uniref:Uncharacterized protein n=1 Tax=Paracoccus spongiarum TaxID=3064387 RepID=A0ABT9JCN8_9RHOB|nr:hypothetical protein [Paracoccus sp. 2205BS29-5]MDP5307587.1 hypothetical protein [Paracoccus sp. 2205BS29-5]